MKHLFKDHTFLFYKKIVSFLLKID